MTDLKDPGPVVLTQNVHPSPAGPLTSFSDLASSYKKDIAMTTAQLAAARADIELEFARVKLFWAKYGHPALYALTAIVSAYVGHKL